MCDIRTTICMTSNEPYVASHPLFMASQDLIHDITPSLYDITYTILVISQPLFLWKDTYSISDIILSIYDFSQGVWVTTQELYPTSYPLYLCNHTHLIDDITPHICLKSHQLHVWHQRHFIWHHIHSWWHHTIVCMSWHPLCLWYHIHYIWCHPHCVHDYTSSISVLTPVIIAIPSTLYVITPLCRRHHTIYVRHYRWHMYAIMWTIHDTISTL